MILFKLPLAFALLPLPLLARYLLPVRPAQAVLSLPGGLWQLLTAVTGRGRAPGTAAVLIPLLRAAGWAALVFALAGPYRHGAQLITPTERNVMLAVDLSASMAEAGDAARTDGPSQLDVVRGVLSDFLAGRRGDRVGLIGFATEAYQITPLTYDTNAVTEMLGEVTIGLPGRRTDLGQAIGLTVQVLREMPEADRVLILISDGETNAGDLAARDAAILARQHGIRIHMVGFAPQPEPENLAHMATIAELSGGTFAAATDAEALAEIYANIDAMEPVTSPDQAEYLVDDWTWPPLIAALVIAVFLGWREVFET